MAILYIFICGIYFGELSLSIAREIAEKAEEVITKVKPSFSGFLRRYLLCLTPAIAVAICHYAEYSGFLAPIIGVARPIAILWLMIVFAVIAWVLRSKEALASTIIAIICSLAYTFYGYEIKTRNIFEIWSQVSARLDTGVLIGSAAGVIITMLLVEIYRKSITYTITDLGVHLEGGLWRRQEHFMPYNQIGRFVLEQSLIGKIFGYGTIIPVGVAEWGSEYYTRGVGVAGTPKDTGKAKIGAGLMYARTLKEVSRDPLKCLYGVKNPKKLYETLTKYLSLPLKAELEQVKYLKKLAESAEKKE